MPDVLIPIPLHWRRQIIRGFNQSYAIAAQIAKNLDIALFPEALIKVKHSPPQQKLSRKKRLNNLRGSFRVNRNVEGLSIALFDDVMTTGTTMSTAAKTLRDAGAIEVVAWCLARTPKK